MRQLDAVAIGQILEFVGELIAVRHFCSAHQHWNNGDVTLQRGSSFHPNEVARVIETAFSVLIPLIKPRRSNQRQQYATTGNAFVDRPAEVSANTDSGHIHEHRTFAELRY